VEGDVYEAVLSPDWHWVAVTRFIGGAGWRLSVLRLDGSEERELALVAFGATPSWSPDSRRIVFATSDFALDVIGADGTGRSQIASAGTEPAWSPDGTRIAFEGGSPQNLDMHIVRPEGCDRVLLAGGPGAQLERGLTGRTFARIRGRE
jgi:hypothetical protein